jgi:hypothetical protein
MNAHRYVTSEELAYWYLRLNGFLSIPNFVVHPDTGGEQRTDVDILGVRFPYRAELLLNPMTDDTPFTDTTDRPYIIIAEVKRRECALNGPWTRRGDQNMHRVLAAIGAFPKEAVEAVADSLYRAGAFIGEDYRVSLACFGETTSAALEGRYPQVPQKNWPQVLGFVYSRFDGYTRQKASHPQWDVAGRTLWHWFTESRDLGDFIRRARIEG